MTFTEAAQSMVELSRDFYRRGWVLGTSGNFSVAIDRHPLRLAITASSLDKGKLGVEQILEVNEEGQVLVASNGKPSAETLLHVAVVRTAGAGAVLHTHSVWSTVLSDYHHPEGGLWIEGYEMLKGLRGVFTHEHREWLPILDNNQDIPMLARKVQLLLEENPGGHGFLVLRHGLYTWGRDLGEAQRHLEILEFLLESIGRRREYGSRSHS